jgi:PPOX class probable F420-dependent enzyme
MTGTQLSEKGRALVDRPVIASFTTINADGSPHTTPLWIDRDGDLLRINTAAGRVKARNIARDPRVSVCLVDPDDPMNVVAVRGTVVEVSTVGADEHIDALAKKYTGADTFGGRIEGQQRLLVRIRCDEVLIG